ncbi:MAG: sigma-70 family RNA polymerase sigma factor [Syntrophomonadaceae bacterium]|jgi:RNA polymerase sigma-70 factor (ECF subfamily)|nr:sigma-70 family RNA polymerase sigma factor [Syntrophomonadaceae bacterium]
MDEDIELVRQALQGVEEGFERLVAKYQDRVYTLCYRYSGNEEDAYDLAQEAFIKAYRSLGTFKGSSRFGTWLYRVTTNVCLDEMRRRKRQIQTQSLDQPVAGIHSDMKPIVFDNGISIDELYEQKEQAEYIQFLLNQLKPEHRMVLLLKDIMEFSYDEIAQMLDVSSGTIKSRLSRARELLRRKLLDREHFP